MFCPFRKNVFKRGASAPEDYQLMSRDELEDSDSDIEEFTLSSNRVNKPKRKSLGNPKYRCIAILTSIIIVIVGAAVIKHVLSQGGQGELYP